MIDAVDDELWATAPYEQNENGTALRMPLRDAIVLYEGSEIDHAYAVSRRPPTPFYLRLIESLL